MIRITCLCALALAATVAPAMANDPKPDLAEVADREARRTMEDLAPAGMAIAVIRDGQTVMTRGYGVRRAGDPAPVDADTVFPIQSMSKAFVTAALAMLVDEGRLGWDDPVQRYIPEFSMADPYLTEHMTVRDLLVHRAGLRLGAGDLLRWPDGEASASEVIAALPYLPLDRGFRSEFIYDNILYTVAGEIVSRVSGEPWQAFLKRRIFAPLAMDSCTADPAELTTSNRVVQHSRAPGALGPQPLDGLFEAPDPAGSVACSVSDIAKWAKFQMGDGVAASGARLLSAERMRDMHSPVTPMRTPGSARRLGGSHLTAYGLGWILSDFHGELMVEHGGSGPGALSNMVMLPERGDAVVVLVNDVRPAIRYAPHMLDRMLRGDAAADWIADVVAREAQRAEQTPETAQMPAPAGKAALPLTAYAGRYRDPWYGDLTVTVEGAGLVLHLTRSRLLRGPLVPQGGNEFVAAWPDRSLNADARVRFLLDPEGHVTGMALAPISEDVDFSYDYADLAPVRIDDR